MKHKKKKKDYLEIAERIISIIVNVVIALATLYAAFNK